MSLRDRVPVEPLDDERIARIERAVITALPARAPKPMAWRYLVSVAIAAVAVAVLAWWRAAPRAAPEPAAPLAIAADAAGTRVDLGDAVIVAAPGARFEVTRPDGGIAVALELGRIELEVAKRGTRPPLVVHADDVDVVVVGTKFTVERDGGVSVTVSEGVVRVERGGERTLVAAGESWTGPRLAVADPVAVPAPDPSGVGEHTSTSPSSTTIATGSSSNSAAKKPTKPKTAPIPAIPDDPLAALRKDIAAQPIAAAAGTTKSAKLYEDARAGYTDNAKVALRLLDQYVQRFPTFQELPDVLWLRVRILCLKNIDDACRSAAHNYIRSAGGETGKGRVAVRITITH